MKIAQVFPHSLSIYQSHAEPLIPMSSLSCEFDLAESSFSSTMFDHISRHAATHYLTLQNFDKPLLNGRSPKSRLSAGFACRRTSGESGATGSCWNQRVLESMGRTQCGWTHSACSIVFAGMCMLPTYACIKMIGACFSYEHPQGKITIQSTFARTRKV